MRVDRFRLMHCMNIRKLTPGQVARLGRMTRETVDAILDGRSADIGSDALARLAKALLIAPEQVAVRGDDRLAAVVMTAEELRATCRPIQRAGIHFYNYYSMAAPPAGSRPSSWTSCALQTSCPP